MKLLIKILYWERSKKGCVKINVIGICSRNEKLLTQTHDVVAIKNNNQFCEKNLPVVR